MKLFKVMLMSVGNPDFGQRGKQSPTMTAPVDNLRDARDIAMAYIAKWNLGAGNWRGSAGCVYPHDSAICIARISYNGRVWTNDETPIEIPQSELEYAL